MIHSAKPFPFDESGIRMEKLVSDNPLQAGIPASESFYGQAVYELCFMPNGGCECFTGQRRVILIPGDLFLLPADRPRSYRLQPGATLFQCLFQADAAATALRPLLELNLQEEREQHSDLKKRVRSLRVFEDDAPDADLPVPPSHSHAQIQHLIHLNHEESSSIQSIYQSMFKEQAKQAAGYVEMKQSYLQQLLILLRRMQLQQFEAAEQQVTWKQDMVSAVLQQIDSDLSQPIDFEEIARQQGITLTYFRTVFKSIVGMPPLDYLNRVRILHALDLLQTTDLSVADIAEKVGIYDANYFTRLFKKIIGYPPRYFKSISK